MASMQDSSPFTLRLFVDKERNRVVVAEASADFVDILFSFLTLPLGTIIRLVSNKQIEEAVEIGCINNLYRSVEKFGTQVFWWQHCKQVLLNPRNPCENLCQKLRVNVDDTQPTKYFICRSCRGGSSMWISTFAGLECPCGKSMDKEMKLQEDDSKQEAKRDGVFVKASTMYLIFDDLNVLQNSPGSSIQPLVQLGYTNFTKLTKISPSVGLKEILELLKRALVSKSALSDVFLGVKDGGGSKPMCSFKHNQTKTSLVSSNACSFKITASKLKNKILFAQVEGDGFDFLSNYLTTPLGSVLKLLDGNISLGSMENLYNSVKGLGSSWFTRLSGTTLLDLHVAPQYGCRKQPLLLHEGETCSYWYGTYVISNNNTYLVRDGLISKKKDEISSPTAMKVFDPRSVEGTREKAVGFMRRPSLFVVMDDLQVMPFTCASSISFLQELNVPLDDLEEHVITIDYSEALNLLGASLTSKTALTNGLFYLTKKSKEEVAAKEEVTATEEVCPLSEPSVRCQSSVTNFFHSAKESHLLPFLRQTWIAFIVFSFLLLSFFWLHYLPFNLRNCNGK